VRYRPSTFQDGTFLSAFAGGMVIRLIHTTAAYWGLLLIAVYPGLHWEMIMALNCLHIYGAGKIVLRKRGDYVGEYSYCLFFMGRQYPVIGTTDSAKNRRRSL
jgi:hypothetical protein